jgi:hypothetical protein
VEYTELNGQSIERNFYFEIELIDQGLINEPSTRIAQKKAVVEGPRNEIRNF